MREYRIVCRVVYSGDLISAGGVKYVTLRINSKRRRLAKREAIEKSRQKVREDLPFLSEEVDSYVVDCYIVKKI